MKKTLLTALGICFLTGVLFAQPQLIAPGANYDPYPINFTDDAQQVISIELTENIVVNSGTTGWTFMVNGTAVPALGVLFSNNVISFQLTTPIDFADRLNVYVSYDGTGDISGTGSGLQLGTIINYQAINNLKWDCSGLTGEKSVGTSFLHECAPTRVIYSIEYKVKQNTRNSIYWDEIYARVNFSDPVDNVLSSFLMIEQDYIGSGEFYVETTEFSYHIQNVCSFTPSVWPVFEPTNGYSDFNCRPTSALQDYVIPSYQLDNLFSGNLIVYPEIDNPLNEYCVGEDVPGHIFEDNTQFNCRFEVEPDRPNTNERVVQFIYGTNVNGGLRIPNTFIDVGGTMIQLTNGFGNPIAFPTPSGFYEGPVFHYDTPPLPGDEFSGYPTHQAYPIYHTGDYSDVAGMRFEVTLRNWGPCNLYNAFDISNRIEETSYIELIESPPAPDADSPFYCEDNINSTVTATGTTGTLRWYSDAALTNLLHTGGTYTHGQTTVGSDTYYVNETLGNGCPGPATEVVLTIMAVPNQPTILTSGTTDFCYDGGVTDVILTADPNEPPLVDHYQWYRNGGAIGGATSNSITLSTIAESGTYTVHSYGITPTFCESPLSDPVVVNIYEFATTTDPADDETCSDTNAETGNASFSVNVNGPANNIRWQRSSNGGTSWVDITGSSVPNDNCTYQDFTSEILRIRGAEYPLNGYLYRVQVTTVAGGCMTYSAPATLTVHPSPVISNHPQDSEICEYENTAFQVIATIASGSITNFRWQENNTSSTSNIVAGFNDAVYSGYTSDQLVLTGPDRSYNSYRYRVYVRSDHGCDSRSSWADLTVNSLPDISTQPQDEEVCVLGTTSFSVTDAGNVNVTDWQWQVSTNNGGSWNNVAGGTYSGGTTTTLTLTNVPNGLDGYDYRVILTSDDGCTRTSDAANLTVHPLPVGKTITSADALVCFGDRTDIIIQSSDFGVIYTVYDANGDVSIGSVTGDGGNVSVETPDLFTSDSPYTFYVIARDGNTCEDQMNNDVIVNVNPQFSLAQLAEDASICVGTDYDFRINLTGGTTDYDIVYRATPAVAASSDHNQNNYTTGTSINTGNLTETTVYSILSAVDEEGCAAESLGSNITITVGANYDDATIAPIGDVCDDADVQLRLTSSGGTPPYTYEITGTDAPVGEFDVYTIDTTISITISGVAVGVHSYNLITARDHCNNNADVINGNSADIEVFEVPVIAVTNNVSPICNGGATAIDLTSTVNGAISSWEVSDDLPGTASWTGGNLPADGNYTEAGTGYTIAQTLQHNATVPVTVSYEIYSIGPGFTACPSDTITVDVVVQPTALVTSLAAVPICNSTELTYTITSSTVGTTFEWSRAAIGGISNPEALNQTSNPIVETLVNTTANPIPVIYNITPTYNSCPGTPFTLTVTVSPTAVIDSPLADTICDITQFLYTISTSTTSGTITYEWDRPDVADIANPAASNTIALIDETLDNTSTEPVPVPYELTPSVNGCPGTPSTLNLLVNPTPVITSGTSRRICDNAALGYTMTSSTSHDSLKYSWTRAAVSGINTNTGGSGTTALINENLDNSTDDDLLVNYALSTSIMGCPGTPASLNVTVDPTPMVTVPATLPAICSGGTISFTISSDTDPFDPTELTFDVSVAAVPSGSISGTAWISPGGLTIGDDVSGTLINSSNVPVTVTYTVTPILGTCADGSTQTVQVVVNPIPVATPANNAPNIITGTDTDIDMDASVVGTTFDFTVLNGAVTGAFDDAGYIIGQTIAQTLTIPAATPELETYIITPTANGCVGDTVHELVNIYPDVDMTVDPDTAFCSGGVTHIDISSSVAGATFDWTVVSGGATGATDGSSTFNPTSIVETLTNSTTSAITVVYEILPTGPGPLFTPGLAQQVEVIVYPYPTGTYDNDPSTICNGSQTSIELDADVTGSTFTWTIAESTPGYSGATASGAPADIGDIIAQTLDNIGTVPYNVTYNIRPTLSNNVPGVGTVSCVGTITAESVIINPTPVANISNIADTLCNGDTTNITLNAAVTGTTFIWNVPLPNGTGATGGSGPVGTVIEQELVNTTQSPITVTYEIIPQGPGTTACPGSAVYEDVTVNPTPVTTPITGIDTVCEGTGGLVYEVDLTNNSYYEWFIPPVLGTPSFGGSGDNSNAVVMIAANTAAQITDSLWVFETNQYGCSNDTMYHPLTIDPVPAISTIAGDNPVCAFTTHNYSIADHPDNSYQWIVPPGASIVSTDVTIYNVDVSFGLLQGQVRVIETTPGGCVTTHTPLMVTVNQLPITTLNALPTAACVGDPITFTAGPTGAGINYEFFVNGISAQNGATATYVTDSILTGDQVTVNVTSSDGCEKLSLPVQVTIYDLPVVTLTSTAPLNTICAGENVDFTANSASAVNYDFYLIGSGMQQTGPLNFWSTTSLVDGNEVYVEVMSAFGCLGASDTITTMVNPLPVAVLSGDNTICPGDITPLTVNITTGTPNYDVTVDNGVGTISGYASGDPIPVSPVSTTIFNLVSVTDALGCTSAILNPSGVNLSGTATITLHDTVQIQIQPHDAAVCEGIDTSFTVVATGEVLTYQWQSTQDLASGFTDIAVGGNAAPYVVSAPDASVDSTYYRVFVNGTCAPFAYSDTVQLVLKYDPALTGHPQPQIICENDGTGFGVDAGLTASPAFLWQVSYDNGANWLNLADTAVYNGSSTDSLTVISASSRFNGYQYRAMVTGECGTPTPSNSALLTIEERPEIIREPSDTAVCEGLPAWFEVDAGVTSGVSYLWEVDMGSGFVTLGDTAGIYNLAGHRLNVLAPSSRFDGYNYRVSVSGNCTPPRVSEIVTLTVLEEPEFSLQPIPEIICEEQNVFFQVAPGSTTAPTYLWQVDMGAGFADIGADTGIYSGSGTQNLFLTTVPSSYDGYIYRAVISGYCASPATSDEVMLTVNENPEISIQPVNDTVCEGDAATFMVAAGLTTIPTYQWEVNRLGSWEELDDATDNVIGSLTANLTVNNPVATFNGYRYRVVIRGTCTPPVTSEQVELIVDRRPEVLIDPVDETVCEDEDIFFVVHPGSTTEPVIAWEYSLDNTNWDPASDLPEAGDISNDTLFLTVVPAGYDGYMFHAVVSGKCSTPATSATAVMTVYEHPEITTQPVNRDECENDTVMFFVEVGFTTNPVYQWEIWNGATWITPPVDIYEGANNDTLYINGIHSGIDGQMIRLNLSGICSPNVISDTAILTVYERPEIVVQPHNAAVCEGIDTSFTVVALGEVLTYQWQSTQDLASGFTDIAVGGNAASYVVSAPDASIDSSYYRVFITGTCTPDVYSDTVQLVLKYDPELTGHPQSQTICENEGTGFGVEAGLTASPAYLWQVSYDNGANWLGLADTAVYNGSSTDSLTVISASSRFNGYQYRAMVSGECGTPLPSNSALLTIEERPEILYQSDDTAVCEGTPAWFEVDAGVTTGVSYLWEVNMGGGFVTLGDTAGVYTLAGPRLNVLAPSSSFNGYRYRVTVSGNCIPDQPSNAMTLTILEAPEFSLQPVPKIICEEQNTFFQVAPGATTAPTYLWQVDMGLGFVDIGADTGIYSGAGTTSLFLATVPSTYDGYIYRAVISGYCASAANSDEVLLTVNENPEISIQPVNDTVCEGDAAIYMVHAGVTTLPTYQWQVNRIGIWQDLDDATDNVVGSLTANLTVNNPVASFNGYRYRVVISGTCTPAINSEEALLIVDRRPEVLIDPVDKAVCEDENIFFVVHPGSTTEPVIAWEYSLDGTNWDPASDLPEAGDISNDTLFLTAVPSGYDGYMFHAVVSGKCSAPATSATAVMTVYEHPEISTQPLDRDACENDTVMFFVEAGFTTNPVYQWEIWNGAAWITPPVGIYEGANNDTLYINGIHSGIDGQMIRLNLSGICSPNVISDTAVLTVYERPEIIEEPEDVTICEGDSTFFGVNAGVTTGANYEWQHDFTGSWTTATGGFFVNESSDTLLLEGVPASWTGTQFRAIVSNLCGPDDTTEIVTLMVNNRPEILPGLGDLTTCEGVGVSYTIDAGVTTNAAYLWEVHNGTSWQVVTGAQYSGQGTATLSIPNPTSAMHLYAYRVQVSGYCDPALVSDSVSLTIEENAEISLQPEAATICELGDTLFTVEAGVTTNPGYLWEYNDLTNGWQSVSDDGIHLGQSTPSLALSGVPFSMDNWEYRVTISGDCGPDVTSTEVPLVVYKLPEISLQPEDTTTCELRNVSFYVETGDTDAPFLQWEVDDGSGWQALMDGGHYVGSNLNELLVFSVDSAMNGYRYRVLVSGACDPGIYSDSVDLIVDALPDIWTQPEGVSICEGDVSSFSVMATGTGLSYTWQVDMGGGFLDIVGDTAIYSGAATSTLTLTGANRNYHLNRYRVRVEGICEPYALSDLAILQVQNPPEISTQPGDNVLCEYANAVFQVDATGEGLSYQWQESMDNGGSWNNLADAGLYVGSTTFRLTIFSVERDMDAYQYRVNISGLCGIPAQSAEVLLTVQTAPDILEQPVTISVCENMPAGFGIDAEGTGISYQWMVHEGTTFRNINVSEAEYSGADSDSLTLLSAQLTQSGYRYMVVVSGTCPSAATSDVAIVMVEPNPLITVQPLSDAVCENGAVLFTAGSTGPAGMTYQWYVDRDDSNGFVPTSDSDGVHMGSTTEQLSISNATVGMDGWVYHLQVSTACMPVTTNDVTLTVWDNPVPTITPTGTFPFYPLICGGDVLTMDGSPVGGSGTYNTHSWSGAIGPLSATDVQVVDFETVIKGQYTLAYTVTDSRGCVGTDVVTIENERPTAQYTSDAMPSCGYVEVNFTNQSSAEATSFLWDFADSTTSTLEDVTHGFDNISPDGQVAYYNVFMEAISDHDCRDTARSVITIYPKVVATIDADPIAGCQPLNVTFLTTPGAGSYLWDFGDGSVAVDGGYVVYHMYDNFGEAAVVRTVQLTTTSFYGCVDSETVDITVEPIPAPNFTATPMVQTYPDATVNFTNQTSNGPWTFTWDFGDGNSSVEENPEHTYVDPGTYMVRFYVNNGDCIDSTGTTVVIHPRVPIAAFAEPPSGCTPLEIQFVNQSQWAKSYLWDFGDGYVSTKENPSHTFYDPGEVTVRLQANGPGGTVMTSWDLNVYETPNVAFNSAPDSVFVKDKPVRFFNLSSGATDYQWDFGDYYEDGEAAPLNFSNEADDSHIYYTEGIKDVKLVAWNEFCTDSLILPAVKVIPAGDIQFPTVFRPDPNGPSGGAVDPNNPSLDPGTANSIFFPGVNKQVDEYHMYIYNRWGELIFQSHDINIGWDGYIRGTLAAQGVYLWKVTLVYKNGSPDSMAGDITLLWKREQ